MRSSRGPVVRRASRAKPVLTNSVFGEFANHGHGCSIRSVRDRQGATVCDVVICKGEDGAPYLEVKGGMKSNRGRDASV